MVTSDWKNHWWAGGHESNIDILGHGAYQLVTLVLSRVDNNCWQELMCCCKHALYITACSDQVSCSSRMSVYEAIEEG